MDTYKFFCTFKKVYVQLYEYFIIIRVLNELKHDMN